MEQKIIDYVTNQREIQNWEMQKAAIKKAFYESVLSNVNKDTALVVLQLDFPICDEGWVWSHFKSEVANPEYLPLEKISVVSVHIGHQIINGRYLPSSRIELEIY